MSTREQDQARRSRAEHERWIEQAAAISDEEFRARLRAWDIENPQVAADLTPQQRGY